MTKIILLSALLFGGLSFACAQNKNDLSFPEKVGFKKQLQILEVLKGDDIAAQEKVFREVSKDPDAYIPPVLHQYAGELFEDGKSKNGWFWHFVAELRGRIDANLSVSGKAMQFVSFLTNMHAATINPENELESLDQLKQTVKEVVCYVRNTPVTYDRSWIVLLKFKAEPAGQHEADMTIQFMKPKKKWDAITQKTIDDYYHNFQKHAQKAKEASLKIPVTAVSFNYTPYEIGRIEVNGQAILGVLPPADEYGPGGGGGSHAGLLFESGQATIQWMIGGKIGEDAFAGDYRTAQGAISELPEEAEDWKMIYLGVHIYPDTVRFTLDNSYPISLKQMEQ